MLIFLLLSTFHFSNAQKLVEKPFQPKDSHAPKEYALAWADEFNAFQLDTTEWFYRDGIDRQMTIMAQENVILDHDNLNIVCQAGQFRAHPEVYRVKEGKDFFNQKGGGVISEWRFREGYFEARCKMLNAPLWHPAFWLERANSNPENNSLKTFTTYSEIDIMETEPNHATWQSIRVHDWVSGGEHRKIPIKVKENDWGRTYCTDQHGEWFVWGMKLTHEKAMFYENDSLVATVEIPEDYVRDARNIILSCLSIKSPKESGIQKFDWVRFYEPETMRASTTKECENLIQHTSIVGKDIFDTKVEKASGGYCQNIVNAKKGDFIRYRVYISEKGKYNIKLGYLPQKQAQGTWNLSIDGVAQGEEIDQKGKAKFKSFDLGEKTFDRVGFHEFKFEMDVANGTTGSGTFDYLEVTKLDPEITKK
ncbi:hypothetical protein V6R21_01095 [Limibacter armeniacum]|uniref:glycoside hydrolase family 16 protein n=1 Tax=Limibacter armeniacum TaxID=466084 RepID=UPI002FE5EBF9